MGNTTGLKAQVDIDCANALDSLKKLDDKVNESFVQVISSGARYAAIALDGLAVGATAMSANFIHAADDMEKFQNSLTVLTGSSESAKQELDSLGQAAQKSAFGFEEMATAATRIQALRQNIQEVLPVAQDLAAFSGKDLVTSATQLAKAMSGSQIAIRSLSNTYGISRTELGKFGAALTSTGGIAAATTDEIHRNAKAILEVANMKFGGLAQAQADTFSSAMKQMQSALFEFSASAGEELQPAAVGIVHIMTDVVNAFNGLNPVVKASIGVGTALAAVFLGIGAAGASAFAIMTPLMSQLDQLAKIEEEAAVAAQEAFAATVKVADARAAEAKAAQAQLASIELVTEAVHLDLEAEEANFQAITKSSIAKQADTIFERERAAAVLASAQVEAANIKYILESLATRKAETEATLAAIIPGEEATKVLEAEFIAKKQQIEITIGEKEARLSNIQTVIDEKDAIINASFAEIIDAKSTQANALAKLESAKATANDAIKTELDTAAKYDNAKAALVDAEAETELAKTRVLSGSKTTGAIGLIKGQLTSLWGFTKATGTEFVGLATSVGTFGTSVNTSVGILSRFSSAAVTGVGALAGYLAVLGSVIALAVGFAEYTRQLTKNAELEHEAVTRSSNAYVAYKKAKEGAFENKTAQQLTDEKVSVKDLTDAIEGANEKIQGYYNSGKALTEQQKEEIATLQKQKQAWHEKAAAVADDLATLDGLPATVAHAKDSMDDLIEGVKAGKNNYEEATDAINAYKKALDDSIKNADAPEQKDKFKKLDRERQKKQDELELKHQEDLAQIAKTASDLKIKFIDDEISEEDKKFKAGANNVQALINLTKQKSEVAIAALKAEEDADLAKHPPEERDAIQANWEQKRVDLEKDASKKIQEINEEATKIRLEEANKILDKETSISKSKLEIVKQELNANKEAGDIKLSQATEIYNKTIALSQDEFNNKVQKLQNEKEIAIAAGGDKANLEKEYTLDVQEAQNEQTKAVQQATAEKISILNEYYSQEKLKITENFELGQSTREDEIKSLETLINTSRIQGKALISATKELNDLKKQSFKEETDFEEATGQIDLNQKVGRLREYLQNFKVSKQEEAEVSLQINTLEAKYFDDSLKQQYEMEKISTEQKIQMEQQFLATHKMSVEERNQRELEVFNQQKSHDEEMKKLHEEELKNQEKMIDDTIALDEKKRKSGVSVEKEIEDAIRSKFALEKQELELRRDIDLEETKSEEEKQLKKQLYAEQDKELDHQMDEQIQASREAQANVDAERAQKLVSEDSEIQKIIDKYDKLKQKAEEANGAKGSKGASKGKVGMTIDEAFGGDNADSLGFGSFSMDMGGGLGGEDKEELEKQKRQEILGKIKEKTGGNDSQAEADYLAGKIDENELAKQLALSKINADNGSASSDSSSSSSSGGGKGSSGKSGSSTTGYGGNAQTGISSPFASPADSDKKPNAQANGKSDSDNLKMIADNMLLLRTFVQGQEFVTLTNILNEIRNAKNSGDGKPSSPSSRDNQDKSFFNNTPGQ